MGMAFGISEDDVATVAQMRLGRIVGADSALAGELLELLDQDAVERAALRANEMDEQIEGAYDEMERQLRADPAAMQLLASARETVQRQR